MYYIDISITKRLYNTRFSNETSSRKLTGYVILLEMLCDRKKEISCNLNSNDAEKMFSHAAFIPLLLFKENSA